MWPCVLVEPNALQNVRLITGNSHPELAQNIAQELGIELSKCVVTEFSNTETRIKPPTDDDSTFRGKDIFVLSTGSFDKHRSVNDHLMETWLLMDACRRGGCKSITIIAPCLPYARQDKKDFSRAPISSKMVANVFEMIGLERMVCFDLHNPTLQGFIDKSCDNLFTTKLMKGWLMENIFHTTKPGQGKYLSEYILISPDEGALTKTRIIANALGLPFFTMSKTRDYSTENRVEKTVLLCDPENISRGPINSLLSGKFAIILDDMIDTAGTVVTAVETLMNYGAKGCGVAVTHGILSGPALERINECKALEFVLVSDSLPQTYNQSKCQKIRVYSVAGMLAEVIRRITVKHSLGSLF